jgi:hypothetical protein
MTKEILSDTASRLKPFGEASCQEEVEILGDEYQNYYFHHTPFNTEALDPKTFLIIGRRGAGKSALSQYFTFQQRIRNSVAIDIDEPEVFQAVLNRLSRSTTEVREVAIPRLVKIWEVALWSVLFREFQHRDPRIKTACIFGDQAGKTSHFIRHLLKAVAKRLLQSENALTDEFEELISDERLAAGRKAILEIAATEPIILAFDTLENYSLRNESMLRATASLVHFASDFNRKFSPKGIHLKLFIMAEVYPYLKQEVMLNPLKTVRDEIFLHWRPKALMRLISWRLFQYLRSHGYPVPAESSIVWDSYQDVLTKMWVPYFGDEIRNGRGRMEKTFPYVLRHTQMRPRQLILLCNEIARMAEQSGNFPHFTPQDIVSGIQQVEQDLADEVYSAYNRVYPNAGDIVEALSGLPVMFKGKELDKRAHNTAAAWPEGEYTSLRFRQLVAELGIVGRVRSYDERSGIVEADFEYSKDRRIPLLVDTDCVVHPMFFHRLNIDMASALRIYPFPDHQEYRELGYPFSS